MHRSPGQVLPTRENLRNRETWLLYVGATEVATRCAIVFQSFVIMRVVVRYLYLPGRDFRRSYAGKSNLYAVAMAELRDANRCAKARSSG